MIAFIPDLKMPETLFRICLGGSGFKQDGHHFLYRWSALVSPKTYVTLRNESVLVDEWFGDLEVWWDWSCGDRWWWLWLELILWTGISERGIIVDGVVVCTERTFESKSVCLNWTKLDDQLINTSRTHDSVFER